MLRDRKEDDARKDHDDLKNAAQVAKQINDTIDRAIMRFLKRFEVDVRKKDCVLRVRSVFSIDWQTQ